MWLRILQRYNLRGSYRERSVRSLQSRWDIIKAEVGKFSSFYADVIRENPSGMLDADKTTHAAANFAGILKHNFAYLHYWEIMKDEPKWQDPKPRAFAKSAGGDGFGEDTINLGDDNSSPTGSAEKRPMGRDSAKAAKKKANSSMGSASFSEYASRMQDLYLQKISILQEESVRKNDRFQQLAFIDEKRFEEMRSHNQSLLLIKQEKIRIMREKHDMDKEEKEKREDEISLGLILMVAHQLSDYITKLFRKKFSKRLQLGAGRDRAPEPWMGEETFFFSANVTLVECVILLFVECVVRTLFECNCIVNLCSWNYYLLTVICSVIIS
ncbi:hypothetical protein PAHAL_2G079300 [Panicum hallii]|uniref:Uncharacterized protein n=1 Tax=Panicum hallii TaxID=206008 RepID=A0A2T8KN97_9POAL|nr:hypothetical protein PAHAL_2G079300 [Panicum hallii]